VLRWRETKKKNLSSLGNGTTWRTLRRKKPKKDGKKWTNGLWRKCVANHHPGTRTSVPESDPGRNGRKSINGGENRSAYNPGSAAKRCAMTDALDSLEGIKDTEKKTGKEEKK